MRVETEAVAGTRRERRRVGGGEGGETDRDRETETGRQTDTHRENRRTNKKR